MTRRPTPRRTVPHLTVGQLAETLQGLLHHAALDPDTPVHVAINPDFPFAHHLATGLRVDDGVVYLVEDGQHDYLPAPVTAALDWGRPQHP